MRVKRLSGQNAPFVHQVPFYHGSWRQGSLWEIREVWPQAGSPVIFLGSPQQRRISWSGCSVIGCQMSSVSYAVLCGVVGCFVPCLCILIPQSSLGTLLTYIRSVVGIAFSWHWRHVCFLNGLEICHPLNPSYPAHSPPTPYLALCSLLASLLPGLHQSLGCANVTGFFWPLCWHVWCGHWQGGF